MTPEEIGWEVAGWYALCPGADAGDLAAQVAHAVRGALEQDRRTRPTLVGAPLDGERLAELDTLVTLAHQANEATGMPTISAGAATQQLMNNCVGIPHELLGHTDFLRGLVHDLQEERTCYARGVSDGLERAALELERQATEVASKPLSCRGLARHVRALKGAAP